MTDKSKKIEVVGWVGSDCEYFPDCDSKDDGVIEAIAEELRAHGYLFGGDAHGEDWRACTPVLSDGTKASFSWRGWGYVVAVAYDLRGANGEYDHMCGYMDRMINPEALRYPEEGVDFSRITYRGKVHRLSLPPSVGPCIEREYDLRAATGALKGIKARDYIDFEDGFKQTTRYKVTQVYGGSDFEELLDGLCGGESQQIYSDDFGYEAGLTRGQLLERLYGDYPRGEVERHGAVCFGLHGLIEGDNPD